MYRYLSTALTYYTVNKMPATKQQQNSRRKPMSDLNTNKKIVPKSTIPKKDESEKVENKLEIVESKDNKVTGVHLSDSDSTNDSSSTADSDSDIESIKAIEPKVELVQSEPVVIEETNLVSKQVEICDNKEEDKSKEIPKFVAQPKVSISSTIDHNKISFTIRSKENSFLHNYYCVDIVIDNIKYFHVEGYYQSRKFAGMKSPLADKAVKHITHVADPIIAKKRADEYQMTSDRLTEWENIKDIAMKQAVLTKFITNSELSGKLMNTGTKVLINNDVTDAYWGTGKDNIGSNKLGILLMQVRQTLLSYNA